MSSLSLSNIKKEKCLGNQDECVRSEILEALASDSSVFCDIIPCSSPVIVKRHFGGISPPSSRSKSKLSKKSAWRRLSTNIKSYPFTDLPKLYLNTYILKNFWNLSKPPVGRDPQFHKSCVYGKLEWGVNILTYSKMLCWESTWEYDECTGNFSLDKLQSTSDLWLNVFPTYGLSRVHYNRGRIGLRSLSPRLTPISQHSNPNYAIIPLILL
jgi:hypothetical protein